MGLSFDLNVTELPDKILDLAFASHAWFDSGSGITMGYSENALDANGDGIDTGSPGWIGGGFLDIVSTGRWAGIQPVPGSWVINDIKTANGTVFLCGSYAAEWKGTEWNGAGYDTNPDLIFDVNSVDASFSVGQPFIDGFFACCRYDLLDNPKAWHILPTRSLIEMPEMTLPANAILPSSATLLNDYVAVNTQGGLYDMVIDIRTENPDVRRGWEAQLPELAGQPQPVVVTCVGYMPCEGYGSTVHNSTWVTDSYKWSIYSNQDFLPVVYSFVVNMFDDAYNGKDLFMTNGETGENCINPFYANSQLSFPNSGIGGNESEVVNRHWNYNWLIGQGNIGGINPAANFGYTGIDWNGTSMATQGAFCGLANAVNLQGLILASATLNRPYCSAAGRFGSLQVYPFEQVTYRAHQIGMRGQFSGPFYPMGNTFDTWTAYSNIHPRQPAVNAFWPTPLIGTFPIRKPTEMSFATPNYVPVNTTLYANGRANTGVNEFNPTPNYFGPSKQIEPAYRQTAQTDAEIWRHGFIPRRLTGVERSYNSYANAGPKGGLYFPTYENTPSLSAETAGNVGEYYFTSAISQMVFTGDCLEDVKPNPNAQLTCAVDGGGNPIYSPLCVVANMGQAIAGSDGITPRTQYIQKGMAWTGDVSVIEPQGENYMCNTHFMCLTRRNIYVEDVNAEDYWGNNPENTSLDFATFVKPLPIIHAQAPAINNQVFNVNLLLQSNETTVGTNERRAEIYTLQPWTLNPQSNGLPMDMVGIVPMMTWWGRGERLYEEGPCFVTPAAGIPDDLAYLPSEWTHQQTQGIPLTVSDVAKQRNCFHRYLEPTNYIYGTSVGLGQMVNGYWDARTLPTPPTGGNPKSGPQVMVFDPGTTKIDILPNEDDWVLSPLEPTWGGIYRFGSPNGPNADTNDSPCIYDYWDDRIDFAPQVNNKISNQLYSLPTTNQTKTGPVTPLPNPWQAGFFSWELNNINGANLNGTYISPNPAPSSTYTTIESLVIDLNTAMTYLKGAGVPYSQVYGVGGGRSLNGLDGLTWYVTSDKQGIYLRNANPELAGGNNVEMGFLIIGHNAAPFNNDYYPWNADNVSVTEQWLYAPIQGPVATFTVTGIRQGGVANVGEPTLTELTFKVDAFGDTFNENCPGGASTTRRPACGDYDLDRAQWMVTFADNDKVVSEEGNGFAAISTTADFAEFLDQTQNFTQVPDFFRVAQILNTANTNIYANSLWAARQGSANFDGMVYIGIGAPNITRTYPPLTTTTGISSSTYVWAYWYCDTLIDPVNGFPWVGVKPINPNYAYAGPECATAGILADPVTGWVLGQYLPVGPDWGATGITPVCFTGSQPYVIQGTTGRTVQVWLNYVLYDAIDSIIAVEVMNLGLRVTPENVEWYKRKIMGQEGSEMTLEEVEQWMEQQRNQYQDILKERNRNYRMRRRREEAGSHKPSATEALGEQVAGDFYALDEHTIEDLLPQLRKLPPNPDTDEMMDVDAFGNTPSGDIQKTEEKRRDSEN